MKKLLSMVLALVMALGLCVTTWAAPVAADTTWYNPATAETTIEYTIDNAAKLLGLAQLVNDGTETFENKTITLGADIDLTGVDWTPIGGLDADKEFKGTFNGGGKTIRNLTMTLGDQGDTKIRAGLFASLTGIVKNLTLSNVSISANGSNVWAGALAGSIAGSGRVEDVAVDGFIFTGSGELIVGGLAGSTSSGGVLGANGIAFEKNTTVKNANITVTATGSSYIGGVNGYSSGWHSINNVDAANITLTITANAASSVGGFFGGDYVGGAYNYRDCDVKNLEITLAGAEKVNAGGFAGYPGGSTCFGNSSERWDGGINDCTTHGTITNNNTSADSMLGGYYGVVTGGDRKFFNCIADVDITSSVGTVGGFFAEATADSVAQIYNNCVAKGNVNGAVAGSFAGVTGTSCTYNACGYGTVAGQSFFGTANPPTQYALKLDLQGGTGIQNIVTAPQAESTFNPALKQYQPTREGYKFVGWVADAATTEPLVTSFTLNENTDNSTLYAVWELLPVVTPPADEPAPAPEPDEEPAAPAHEPIRRQHTTAVEDTTDTADTTKADEAKTDAVTSAKTFDAGVAVYGAMAALSLTGTAWVARKKF